MKTVFHELWQEISDETEPNLRFTPGLWQRSGKHMETPFSQPSLEAWHEGGENWGAKGATNFLVIACINPSQPILLRL